MVSKIKLRLTISIGEKSRVPLGTDGLMDAMRKMNKKGSPTQALSDNKRKGFKKF